MAGKTVLVLGGGVGGLVVSVTLRKMLGRGHRIILMDRKSRHEFAPSFLWVMLGWREPSRISRELSLLGKKGIEYVNAEVTEIDPNNRVVKTDVEELGYDYLVIALGAELYPQAIPGLSEAALTPYSLEGSVALRDALKSFASGRLAVLVSSLPFKCPSAPYETALLLDCTFRERGIRDRVEMRIFTPEPLPMPTAGPEVGGAVREVIEGRGIGFHPLVRAVSVDPAQREIAFENGRKENFDLLVAVPPHRSPAVVRTSPLANEAGWIPVDGKTLRTREENVFAIGDVATIPLPGRYSPDTPLMLPKAGVFAHFQALAVARNIAAEIEGRHGESEFGGYGYCFMETGFGKAGIGRGNFYAEPHPAVRFGQPNRLWHWGKLLFEKWWLSHWF